MVTKKTKEEKAISPLTAGGTNPLAPQATVHPVPLTPKEEIDFSFAVNVVKLNRAKAWVNQNELTLGKLAGDALISAIKDRYVAIGGLLQGSPVPQNRGGKIKNMADMDVDVD